MTYHVLPAGAVIDDAGRVRSPWRLIRTGAADALGIIDSIRRDQPGVTPVIVGTPAQAQQVLGAYAAALSEPEAILSRALEVDCDRWLQERQAYLERERHPGAAQATPSPSLWAKLLGRLAPSSAITPPSLFPRGPWPARSAPNSEIDSLRDVLTRALHPDLYIALLPTDQPWQAGAHTKFGGWNDCPDPEAQVAFAKRWFDRHGAVTVASVGDVLEFQVARPIDARETALDMAREHYLFCEDVVEQGTGSIDALAAVLLGATTWYFWWD